jgi:hypothetical protein
VTTLPAIVEPVAATAVDTTTAAAGRVVGGAVVDVADGDGAVVDGAAVDGTVVDGTVDGPEVAFDAQAPSSRASSCTIGIRRVFIGRHPAARV